MKAVNFAFLKNLVTFEADHVFLAHIKEMFTSSRTENPYLTVLIFETTPNWINNFLDPLKRFICGAPLYLRFRGLQLVHNTAKV